MKVYVCECETPEFGMSVVAAFTELEVAQEKMRVEFQGFSEQNPGLEVGWLRGEGGRWGWYSVVDNNGFYVTEIELDAWNG